MRYDRYSRRDRPQRPWGYFNLSIRKENAPLGKFQQLFEKVKTEGMDNFKIPGKYEAKKNISWLKVSEQQFFESQEEIFKYRNNLKNKASEVQDQLADIEANNSDSNSSIIAAEFDANFTPKRGRGRPKKEGGANDE
jgi:hypothetical protein